MKLLLITQRIRAASALDARFMKPSIYWCSNTVPYTNISFSTVKCLYISISTYSLSYIRLPISPSPFPTPSPFPSQSPSQSPSSSLSLSPSLSQRRKIRIEIEGSALNNSLHVPHFFKEIAYYLANTEWLTQICFYTKTTCSNKQKTWSLRSKTSSENSLQ